VQILIRYLIIAILVSIPLAFFKYSQNAIIGFFKDNPIIAFILLSFPAVFLIIRWVVNRLVDYYLEDPEKSPWIQYTIKN